MKISRPYFHYVNPIKLIKGKMRFGFYTLLNDDNKEYTKKYSLGYWVGFNFIFIGVRFEIGAG